MTMSEYEADFSLFVPRGTGMSSTLRCERRLLIPFRAKKDVFREN